MQRRWEWLARPRRFTIVYFLTRHSLHDFQKRNRHGLGENPYRDVQECKNRHWNTRLCSADHCGNPMTLKNAASDYFGVADSEEAKLSLQESQVAGLLIVPATLLATLSSFCSSTVIAIVIITLKAPKAERAHVGSQEQSRDSSLQHSRGLKIEAVFH